MLVFDYCNPKDIFPRYSISNLVLSTIFINDFILELGHVGEPSCLLGCDALLILDVGHSSIIGDQSEWGGREQVTLPLPECVDCGVQLFVIDGPVDFNI